MCTSRSTPQTLPASCSAAQNSDTPTAATSPAEGTGRSSRGGGNPSAQDFEANITKRILDTRRPSTFVPAFRRLKKKLNQTATVPTVMYVVQSTRTRWCCGGCNRPKQCTPRDLARTRQMRRLKYYDSRSRRPAPGSSARRTLTLAAKCVNASHQTASHRTAVYQTKPYQTAPSRTKLHQNAPNVPNHTKTNQTAPNRTKPHHIVLNRTKPHQPTPHHADRTKSHQTTPKRTKPHQKRTKNAPNHTKTRRNRTTPHHTVLNRTKPHQPTPHHTAKPHQTTPNHTKIHQNAPKPTKPHRNRTTPHHTVLNHPNPHRTTLR